MTKLFGGSKPDTSALEAQEKRVKEQEEKLAAEERANAKKKQASLKARSGRSGSRSLLTGLETGVAPEEEKRTNLG